MSGQHTPGRRTAYKGADKAPWEVPGCGFVTTDNMGTGAKIIVGRFPRYEDAVLDSAAPELLEALEGLAADWERVHGKMPDDHEAKSAIAKARGLT